MTRRRQTATQNIVLAGFARIAPNTQLGWSKYISVRAWVQQGCRLSVAGMYSPFHLARDLSCRPKTHDCAKISNLRLRSFRPGSSVTACYKGEFVIHSSLWASEFASITIPRFNARNQQLRSFS